jgi:two-component system NtrC family sensor kinase
LFGRFRPAGASAPVLEYAHNALQFELVAPDYLAPAAVRYQTKLDGLEKNWASWVNSPIRRFPALSEGNYKFQYRVQDAHGSVTEGAPFVFSIRPPGYRTWPAYVGYIFAFSALTWTGFRLYSHRLRRINTRLERLVGERTRDLEVAHLQLVDASRRAGMAEVATSVLHNVGNALNSVNVSANVIAEHGKASIAGKLEKVVGLLKEHEGDLAQFLTHDPKGKLVPKYLELVSEQACESRTSLLEEITRLQQNVDEIAQVVAVQQAYADGVNLVERLDPAKLVEEAVKLHGAGVEPPTAQIERDIQSNQSVSGQRGKILHILVALLRNAHQACATAQRQDARIRIGIAPAGPDRLHLTVTDNGIGIAADDLSRIFNKRVGGDKRGTGFGLHAAANAAAELKGRLTAISDGIGKGATFVLELRQAK